MRFQFSDRGRLVLVALATAIVLIASTLMVFVFVPRRLLDSIQGRWVRFVVMTAVFIVLALRMYWRSRKSPGFWFTFLGFLALHLFGVGRLWAYYNGLSTVSVAFLGGTEFACMALVIYWVLGIGPDTKSHRSKSPWIPEV